MTFRGDGEIDAVVYFGSEQYASNNTNLAVELSVDVWHSVIALAEPAVLLESSILLWQRSLPAGLQLRAHLSRRLILKNFRPSVASCPQFSRNPNSSV